MSYLLVRQQSDWDCSLACLFMLAQYFHKLNINYFQFIKNNNYFQDLNLTQMQRVGSKLGLFLSAYFVGWSDFCTQPIKNPLICQIKNEGRFHFVVVYRKTKKHFLVADPQKEQVEWYSCDRLQKVYAGIVLTTEKSVYLGVNDRKNSHDFVFWNKLVFELLISFLISILTTTFVILNQFLVKVIVDEVLVKHIPEVLTTILLGFVLLFITKLVLRLLLNVVLDKIEINFKKSWNLKFFSQVGQLTHVDYHKYKAHLLLEHYRYFNEILHFYFPTMFRISENAFLALTSLSILMAVNLTVVLPTVFLMIVVIIIYSLLLPWFRRINQQQISTDKKFYQHLLNFFNHYPDYKNRNSVYLSLNQLKTDLNKQVALSKKHNVVTNCKTAVDQILFFLTSVVTIYFLLNTDTTRLLKPGSFVFLFALVNNLVGKGSWFFQHFIYWTKLKDIKKQVNVFLFQQSLPPVIPNHLLEKKIERLHLKEINYSYNQTDFLWKNNINLIIRQHLVVYGNSGVGKSTLLHILAQNIVDYRGTLLINKQPLTKNNHGHGWDKVYFLQAFATLFTDTVLNNIFTFHCQKDFLTTWKNAEIDYFCQKIGLSPHTWISNQTVSAGQRQVVNFLTLFFRSEPILLLDESLNSVNHQLKKELLQKLLTVRKDTLVVYTTHDSKISELFSQRIDLFTNQNEK